MRDLPHLEPKEAVRLLRVEPDLGCDLPPEDFEQALALRLPTFAVAGRWDIRDVERWDGVRGGAFGVLVLEGGIFMQVHLARRACARWLGPGELVLLDGPGNDSVSMDWRWSASETTTVAVLDDRMLAAGCRWPALLRAVFGRAALSARHAFVQQAYSQLPRVEQRLLAVLWAVADRQGQAVADGVQVRLDITHEQLGVMVGARRPTVSLGLKRLGESGLVRESHGKWWLSRQSLQEFSDVDTGACPANGAE